jgi:phytol kinase
MNVIFKQFQFSNLIFIPVLVQGIGDGLAEPVGVRFGKHKYLTKGFLTNRLYTRSIEGSACIFIVGIFAIIIFKSSFDTLQFIAALLTVPIFMTVAEAISPHTWDTPLMYLSGFGALFGIKIFI